jgi:TFIIF-interacting CTD phosphatase-like protein
VNFKDLSKLGRDLNKIIILENNAENFWITT